MPISPRRLKRLKDVIAKRQSGLALVLEDVFDPHNAAAILRTCDGLGIQDVYFIFDKQAPYNPRKVGKVTSSSANKWLTFHIYRSAKNCVKDLKKKKYRIYATTLRPGAKDITRQTLDAPRMALVVGNEHRGISPEMTELADELIYFPMQGFVESFNVSVSATIFLYEIIRQRQTGPTKYTLSTKEQKKLLTDFKKR